MKIKNLKRNALDFILTDILPVETTELFTYKYFYDFLEKRIKNLNMEVRKIMEIKNTTKKKQKLFDGKYWVSVPLKFFISKGNSEVRELNIIQPIAALQIYYFINLFQEELLIYLKQNSIFSLRYQTKFNNLYYKKKKKNIIDYFSEVSNDIEKRAIEQTGKFFDIVPYASISGFLNSDEWYDLNTKYKYFARIDYKSCFDSIYTHAYKWIISRDVNDSKDFNNTNLFTTIDRLLQNINAYSSNGLIIGPEFSRMIAELLLQQIDNIVYSTLLNEGKIFNSDYSIKRWVDDIYIFSSNEELQDYIIELFRDAAKRFLMYLNENKVKKEKLPFILTNWLNELNQYSTNMSNMLFYMGDELAQRSKVGKKYIFKAKIFFKIKNILKRNFNDLIAKYESEKSKLTAYVLETILKKIVSAKIKREQDIFRQNTNAKTLYEMLDYIFYIFSHSANFENTQKVISIVSYINDDVNLVQSYRMVLQGIINKYAYIFSWNNSNDIINLVLLCIECSVEIPFAHETELKKHIFDSDNPINVAVFLIYSKYNNNYFQEIKNEINKIILYKIQSIQNKENILTYREIWWILIFNKSPYISNDIQIKINDIIGYIRSILVSNNQRHLTFELFCDFLDQNSNQFFCWDITSKDILRKITYRTHERTLFRNFKYGQTAYSSIE
jgi:hypothetical protein